MRRWSCHTPIPGKEASRCRFLPTDGFGSKRVFYGDNSCKTATCRSRVAPYKERNPVGHWFEQIIPNLLIYPIKAFRVHTIAADGSESRIPAGKVVVVIDVDDSAQAPHQAAVPKDKPTYYYRTGSDSKAAPHHYLEALRTRHVGAQLTVTYEYLRVVRYFTFKQPQGAVEAVAEIALIFTIENVSKQACYEWVLDWGVVRWPNYRRIYEPRSFESSVPRLNETQKETILPTRSVTKTVSVGMQVWSNDVTQGLWWPAHDTHIRYRAITEHHVPEFIECPIAGNSDRWALGDDATRELELLIASGELQ